MTVLPSLVVDALRRCRWVHELGMRSDCEGCANDGEPGYCRGAGVSELQPVDDRIVCHCGHAVVLVELPRACECSGPDGWHCPSEDAQHWAERDDDPRSTCGYCGAEPE